MFLQETWLYGFEEYKISNVLKNANFTTKSGMIDSNIDRRGRPFGGCAIIWNAKLPLNFKPINTNSRRLCAALVEKNSLKLLLICVYMPCNDRTEYYQNEFSDVIDEMSSLIRSNEDHNPIIGGDFNLDYFRDNQTTSYVILKNF